MGNVGMYLLVRKEIPPIDPNVKQPVIPDSPLLYPPVPSQAEVEQWMLERRKRELLERYLSPESVK